MPVLNDQVRKYCIANDREKINLSNHMSHIIKCNGKEFLCERLKSIKQFYIKRLSDPLGFVPTCSFIKKDKQGYPSGPFSFLRKLFDSGKYRQLLNNLQMYTALIGGRHPTEKQLAKFFNSVLARDVPPKAVMERFLPPFTKAEIIGSCNFNGPIEVDDSPIPFEDRKWSPTKRAFNPITYKSDYEGSLDQLKYLSSTVISKMIGIGKTVSLVNKNIPPYIYKCTRMAYDFWNQEDRISFVGTVSFIQEPGYKLRAVANPGRVFQVLLQPLGDALFRHLKTYEEDCTFDQNKGINRVQSWIDEGRTVNSVDLSDATNHFPLQYIRLVLTRLMKSDSHYHLDMWTKISQSAWLLPPNKDGLRKPIRWLKGQPLGIYPSFAAFAIAHHELLRSLCRELSLKPLDSYVLLGDDVCICDSRLAQMYRWALTLLNVPVSEPKTFCSETFAEFAGAIILQNQHLNPGKWRIVDDDNFLDYLRKTGPSGIPLLQPKQRFAAEIVTALPEPVGFGWNPKGISIERRISSYLDLYYTLNLSVCLDKGTNFSTALAWMMKNHGLVYSTDITLSNKESRISRLLSILTRIYNENACKSRANSLPRPGKVIELLTRGILNEESLSVWLVDSGYADLIYKNEIDGKWLDSLTPPGMRGFLLRWWLKEIKKRSSSN